MTNPNHELVRQFFAALETGYLPDNLLTDDMTGWTPGAGTIEKAPFLGAMKIFAALFAGDLTYSIESMIAEGDRVAAEVQSSGTFLDGEPFHNFHVYILRIRDGRIAHMAEHMNELMIQEKIIPRMQAAMAQAAG